VGRVNGGSILYTSSEVRRAIIDLFYRSKGRRVAIAGFVGDGAESYLPRPKGIELVCWPKAGGTNPNSLRRLVKKGVVVRFADNLHMKVYWAEGQGAVITSANLSTNALGAGDLKELGVKLGRGQVNIQRVLGSLRSRPMGDAELRTLDRQHALLMARQGGRTEKKNAISFADWYVSSARQKWKLWSWAETVSQSKFSKDFVKSQYSVPAPHWTYACPPNAFVRSDWILTCRITGKRISRVQWMFADFVVRVPKSDPTYDKEWLCEIIQVWPLGRYAAPPFRLGREFVTGFRKAVKEFGVERVEAMRSGQPPVKLVDLMCKHCV